LHVGNWEIGYNSQESKIYTVNTLRSANDLGVEYLERYAEIVKQLPEITLPTENLDEVVTDTDET
jgi:hypothetical protein